MTKPIQVFVKERAYCIRKFQNFSSFMYDLKNMILRHILITLDLISTPPPPQKGGVGAVLAAEQTAFYFNPLWQTKLVPPMIVSF